MALCQWQGFVCFMQWHLQGVSGCQALSAYVHTLKMPPSRAQAGPPRGPGAHLCAREPRQAQGPFPSEVNDPWALEAGVSGTVSQRWASCHLLALAVFCPGSHETPGQLPAKTMYLFIFQALSGACKLIASAFVQRTL